MIKRKIDITIRALCRIRVVNINARERVELARVDLMPIIHRVQRALVNRRAICRFHEEARGVKSTVGFSPIEAPEEAGD